MNRNKDGETEKLKHQQGQKKESGHGEKQCTRETLCIKLYVKSVHKTVGDIWIG